MKRFVTFTISLLLKVSKSKYLIINDQQPAQEPIPKRLELWVWWQPQLVNAKPIKYVVPSSGIARIPCPRCYSLLVDFEIAFHLATKTSSRCKLAIKNREFDSTDHIVDCKDITTTEIGKYIACITKVTSEHISFFQPRIIEGRNYSSLSSIVVETTTEVCTISRLMEEINVSNPTRIEFEIFSVTQMAYAYASRECSGKSTTYTIFYRMKRAPQQQE